MRVAITKTFAHALIPCRRNFFLPLFEFSFGIQARDEWFRFLFPTFFLFWALVFVSVIYSSIVGCLCTNTSFGNIRRGEERRQNINLIWYCRLPIAGLFMGAFSTFEHFPNETISKPLRLQLFRYSGRVENFWRKRIGKKHTKYIKNSNFSIK